MKIETQEQADRFNETMEYGPYVAANGHLMVAPLLLPKDENKEEREYQVGDTIRYTSFNAWCAEGCRACAEGDPLPDY